MPSSCGVPRSGDRSSDLHHLHAGRWLTIASVHADGYPELGHARLPAPTLRAMTDETHLPDTSFSAALRAPAAVSDPPADGDSAPAEATTAHERTSAAMIVFDGV